MKRDKGCEYKQIKTKGYCIKSFYLISNSKVISLCFIL